MIAKIFQYTNGVTGDILYYRKNNNATKALRLNNDSIHKKDKSGIYKDGDWTRIKITNRDLINNVNILDVDTPTNVSELAIVEDDKEYKTLIGEYLKVKATNQLLRDKLRIERREGRLEDRINNVNKTLIENIRKGFDKFSFEHTPQPIENSYAGGYGVIQISDVHFNEVVDFPENIYNFEVAEERLNTLFTKAIHKFRIENVNNITIAFTGDLFNAEHVRDKLIMNEVTRAKALQKGFVIISKLIQRLIEEGFEISIASVLGNESRMNGFERMSGVDTLGADNFDFLLIVLLQTRFGNSVTFLNDGDTLEYMLKLGDSNIILLHGDKIKHQSLSSQIENVKLRWFKETGIMATYAIFGHKHSTLITDEFARSASVVGSNGYSKNSLNSTDSYSSQNIYIIKEGIECTSIKLK